MKNVGGLMVMLALGVATVAQAQHTEADCAKRIERSPRSPYGGPFLPTAPTDPWATEFMPKYRWRLSGNDVEKYAAGIDHQVTREGRPSAFLRSIVPGANGFASVLQKRPGESLRGKRIRVAAWVRAEDLTGWAGLWMTVDGAQQASAFDNLRIRERGPDGWTWSEVVLDVPADATSVQYGFVMNAAGAAWVNGLTIEEVDASVATTELGI